MRIIDLSNRQQQILHIVRDNGPITGEHIAERLGLTRATLRPDLAILTMAGFLDARPRVGYFYSGKTHSQLLTDEIQKMTVKQYQSIPVVIEQSASVYEAVTKMFLEDIGTLFIVDEQSHLAGVVSRKDLLRASLGNRDLAKIPVNIIMTRMPNITTCGKEDLLTDVAGLLIEKQIDGLPVIKKDEDRGGYVVIGRITKTNVTKAFVELASEETV